VTDPDHPLPLTDMSLRVQEMIMIEHERESETLVDEHRQVLPILIDTFQVKIRAVLLLQ
jgi:hypothetical protein